MIPLSASQCTIGSEELPMTMQVGMVASDGVIIASDQKAGRWERFKTTGRVEKTFCDEKLGAVYAGSGSDVGVLIGRRMIEIASSEPASSMTDCAERAAKEICKLKYEAPTFNGPRYFESVLIAHADESGFGLWQINVREVTELILCTRILDKAINGDMLTSAIFFSERYFPDGARGKTISSLLPLAAHIVLMAGKINPSEVSGLEIAICRRGECRKLGESELHPLREFSNHLDAMIETEIRKEDCNEKANSPAHA